ncbi:MAG: lysophospholipid acyltransferase family protein [Gemmatimonadales bacterium]|nr:lysophospholipid acyltransferase family protein [Gemmatimonadales bacterium]
MRPLLVLVLAPAFTVLHSARMMVASALRVPYRLGGIYDEVPRSWSRWILAVAGITVETEGLDALPPGAYVYAANHLSFIDVWALMLVLPDPVRFVAKAELARIPFLSFAMRNSRQIFVDRADARQALGAYDGAAAQIRAGASAVVFPEGTRSRDGGLQPFKKGPFVLAIAAQVPVVPVGVTGSFELLRPDSAWIRSGHVRLAFGAPIPTAGMTYDDRERLLACCRERIAELVRMAPPPAVR